MSVCKKHGYTEYICRSDGKYRCKQCASDSVKKRRHKIKEKLVEYKGGKCQICGYNKCLDALEFHHTDKETKEFNISSPNFKSFKKLLSESDKCILLCSNCHKEIHSKIKKEEKSLYLKEIQDNIKHYKENCKKYLG